MRPLDTVRGGLLAVLVAMGVGAFTIPFVADFFSLELPSGKAALAIAAGVVVGGVALAVVVRFQDQLAGTAMAVAHRIRRR